MKIFDISDKKSNYRNLWVSGLAAITRAQDLKQIFSKLGKVVAAKVVTNAKTPGARCYGFVTMATAEDAQACIKGLNLTELHGKLISVEALTTRRWTKSPARKSRRRRRRRKRSGRKPQIRTGAAASRDRPFGEVGRRFASGSASGPSSLQGTGTAKPGNCCN
ncbi:unnamed protein product [Nesidiocoris tenuis]|uniref:RRM domain-containing protein n=1 Tax=Nesidiocoris tenuis TaxID=355587 RepID=A0A6H5HZA5_9HEMI|nr:unnamed protein product [Nesidiocoris tenuis]